ncbi:MAG: acyl-CoA dehydratase activase [Candidatus Hodarchaeota archaeon]
MSHYSLFAGIDVGSSFTKVILLDQDKKIKGSKAHFSGTELRAAAKQTLKEALPKPNQMSHVKGIIATGYGREIVQIEETTISTITEISCSAKAAQFYYPDKALSIVDIGGQDTKIIKTRDGKRTSFKMNRKCAAGTGTFLEELALKLRVQTTDLDKLAKRSKNPKSISSYCTVFAATEILSRIREGDSIEDMVRGAFHSIVKRVIEIDVLDNEVILTGGVVAHNPTIIEIFERELGKPVSVPPSPHFFVALGAALYALEADSSV